MTERIRKMHPPHTQIRVMLKEIFDWQPPTMAAAKLLHNNKYDLQMAEKILQEARIPEAQRNKTLAELYWMIKQIPN